jgi:hypothetical protein
MASASEEMFSKWMAAWPRAVARSWLDKDFLQELVRDPHGVLTQQYGVQIPEGWSIKVVPGVEEATVSIGKGEGPVLVLRLPEKPQDLTPELGELLERILFKAFAPCCCC